MRKISSNTKILIGGLVGLLIGVGLTTEHGRTYTSEVIYGAQLVSNLFLDLLKLVLVPLVFTSIAIGVANLQSHKKMHKVWFLTLGFFGLSMTLAILLGFTASSLFKPGLGMHLESLTANLAPSTIQKLSVADYSAQFLHGIFQNPFKALANGDIFSIVVCALILGIAIVAGGERYKNIRTLLKEAQELCMQVVGWIMHIAPYGVAALLLQLVAKQDAQLLNELFRFILVVIGTTLFHGVVILPLLLYIFTGISPLRFWRGAKEALITAFATCSSNATLPVTLRCTEQHLHVKRDIANFVVPLGATVNMDGTALYEAVAALFIARLCGIELDIVQQLIIFVVATIGAIGAPGMPSVGMLSMVLVLESVGLPSAAIAILLPIDRILDTVRTSVNVQGDMIGSLIVDRWTRDDHSA